MADWLADEEARRPEWMMARIFQYEDDETDTVSDVAEYCFERGKLEGDVHGYRRGLLEALRIVEHEVASGPGAYSATHAIRVLADKARAGGGRIGEEMGLSGNLIVVPDSGQGEG